MPMYSRNFKHPSCLQKLKDIQYSYCTLTVNMGNLTQEKEIIHYIHEKDDFNHPLSINITLNIISVLTITSLLVINRRLSIYLRRPNRRCIDKIVDFQCTITHVVSILAIMFSNIIIWTEVAESYITEDVTVTVGCYIGSYIFYFVAPYGNIHSFFIALFRYICILHPDKLSRFDISPEVGRFYLSMKKHMFLLDPS